MLGGFLNDSSTEARIAANFRIALALFQLSPHQHCSIRPNMQPESTGLPQWGGWTMIVPGIR